MKARLAMALVCGALLAPLQAFADPGYATTAVNLRAGPGTGYPAIVVVPRHASVNILGCLNGYSWCDVSWGAYRGWIAGDYLRARPHGRVTPLHRSPPPVTTFNFNTYWDMLYRDRPFYRDRDRWRNGHHDGPPHRNTPAGNPPWSQQQPSHPRNQPWNQPNNGPSNHRGPNANPGWGHDHHGNRCRLGTPGCR